MPHVERQYTIEGTFPILLHNGDMANPRNIIVKRLKDYTKKRNKTDEDLEIISQIEWFGGLYLTEPIQDTEIDPDKVMVSIKTNGKICLPRMFVLAGLAEGAKTYKLGKHFKKSCIVLFDSLLEYNGPEDINELSQDQNFIDSRMVRVQTSKNLRTRLIFKEWKTVLRVNCDTEVMNLDELDKIVEATGKYVGYGDYRPMFGKFEVIDKR